MTVQSSYQPFLIGQGQSKTGLFSYLESWIKPEDAFDVLLNAYVYRGSLWQREGMTLFTSAEGNGALVYQNNEIIATGNGGSVYSGTTSRFPIISNTIISATTVTVIAQTSGGKVTLTDTGTGTLTGNMGSSGTLNYTTGDWMLNFGANTVSNGVPIVMTYDFVPISLTTPINNPIMGIKTHQNSATNTQTIVVMDTRRLSWWSPGLSVISFIPVSSFQQIFWEGNGDATVMTTGDITLQWTNIAPYSVSITDGLNTIQDNPTNSTTGTFTHNGNALPDGTNFAAGSTINYVTGVIHINFVAGKANTVLYTITGSVQGDYFTGDNTQFFNATNWQTNDDQPAYLYLTNNKDFVTLFDGTYLARPPFAVTVAHMILDDDTSLPLYPNENDIATTLDIKVFKNRLLFLRPTLVDDSPDTQMIRWSALANDTRPLGNFNFVADAVGNGGFLAAATGDWLQCAQLLRDVIIVFFQNSTWLFRFTGNVSELFRFDQINSTKSTNAPYGSESYDVNATSMGAKGLISCDGVGLQRYDIEVIDQFLDINQNAFGQCFATRFDTLNQTWMLYPSMENDNSTSDSIIVYNFLENTWAKFQHNLGGTDTLSCLGLGFTTKDATWADFAVGQPNQSTWSQATRPWNSYFDQDLSPSLLGGDQKGFVYVMQDGPTDNPGPQGTTVRGIPTLIQTKRLNPFIETGEKARFGYLDVYYEINSLVQVTFNFYINNSENIALSKPFIFNGPVNNIWGWKRIYLNLTGEFLQIEINSQIGSTPSGEPIYNTTGVFKILGMILYAMPSGRLTPGTFV